MPLSKDRGKNGDPRIEILISLVAFLLLSMTVFGEEPPDWAKRDYSGSVDQVFAAALSSIQEQHHEVKSKDMCTTR